MKTKMLKIQSLFLAAVLLLAGCNQNDNDPDGEPVLSISPSTDAIAFSAEATESYTYSITTNQPLWLATSDQDWCVVTMDAYNNSFTVTALPNGADTPPPAAKITVSAGSENTLTITATQAAVTSYDVYVSGYYETADYNTYACYWKNGVRTNLPLPEGSVSSLSSSIAVSGASVYMSGDLGGAGCYWKDGQRVDLPNPAESGPAGANSIAVEGTDVYTLGLQNYWKNTTAVDVKVRDFTPRTIAVGGGSVYITGQLYLSILGRQANVAALWKDGSSKNLSTPVTSNESDALCAAFSGGSVYIGGYYRAGNMNHPCYWKGEVCTQLTDVPAGADDCAVRAICIVNGTVYAAGTCEGGERSIACYWENGSRTELKLPDGAYNATVTGITVAGGKVCASGQYQDRTDKACACYWINGERTDLPKGSAESAYATGIALIVNNK